MHFIVSCVCMRVSENMNFRNINEMPVDDCVIQAVRCFFNNDVSL